LNAHFSRGPAFSPQTFVRAQETWTVKSLTRILILPVAMTASLAGGCASPGPPAPRFSAPAEIDQAGEWVGRYAGKGSVYVRSAGDWLQDVDLELVVRSPRPNVLTFAGVPATGGWAFALEVRAVQGGVLAGDRTAPDGLARYEYSFARTGDRITGLIKRHGRVDPHDNLQLPDEWVFEAQREPAGPSPEERSTSGQP